MAQLFNRDKNHTTIAELEEYYASKNKNSGSLKAWFMAFLSLFITAAVIVALFFGARWLWNVVTNDSDNELAQTTSDQSGVRILEDGTVIGDIDSLSDNATSESNNNGVVTDEAATTTRDAAGSTTPSSNGQSGATTTPSTDRSVTNTSNSTQVAGETTTAPARSIPNTGAASTVMTLLVFVAGAFGFIAARTHYAKK